MTVLPDGMLHWSKIRHSGADPGIGSGGGAQVRVWQGVGQSWRRSHPGEGAGGGHPSRPARGSGGALQAPPAGSGAEPQKPTLFALKTPPKST